MQRSPKSQQFIITLMSVMAFDACIYHSNAQQQQQQQQQQQVQVQSILRKHIRS